MGFGLGFVGHILLLLAADSGRLVQLALAGMQPALHIVPEAPLLLLDVPARMPQTDASALAAMSALT